MGEEASCFWSLHILFRFHATQTYRICLSEAAPFQSDLTMTRGFLFFLPPSEEAASGEEPAAEPEPEEDTGEHVKEEEEELEEPKWGSSSSQRWTYRLNKKRFLY